MPLIAGLLLGGAMWTKPTAGAFIWGVLLLLALDLWRVKMALAEHGGLALKLRFWPGWRVSRWGRCGTSATLPSATMSSTCRRASG